MTCGISCLPKASSPVDVCLPKNRPIHQMPLSLYQMTCYQSKNQPHSAEVTIHCHSQRQQQKQLASVIRKNTVYLCGITSHQFFTVETVVKLELPHYGCEPRKPWPLSTNISSLSELLCQIRRRKFPHGIPVILLPEEWDSHRGEMGGHG